jgi:hypothetical protein
LRAAQNSQIADLSDEKKSKNGVKRISKSDRKTVSGNATRSQMMTNRTNLTNHGSLIGSDDSGSADKLQALVQEYQSFIASARPPRPSFWAWVYFWELSDRERAKRESSTAYILEMNKQHGEEFGRNAENVLS